MHTPSAFFAAIQKEILQQWRTKRLLVVIAVFLMIGLGSPVIVKLTPEILKSTPEGAEIANIMPPLTAADAVSSYVNNIGTLGIILAILMGMNAVAGEKESGTAALTLSKPMPRWAFVLSKFTAQAIVYITAFLVSSLGAYFCTLSLFGPPDISVFLTINLLLLFWFMTNAGIVLLASVIGSSVAAAGGLALALSFLFGLSRNIPRFGSWTPNGLMAWAAELSVTLNKVVGNPGAVVGSLVLVVICLVASVVVFERQEIK